MATLTQLLLPISGYTNQYYTYQCVVTENSYSVANNTSNVTITFSIKGPWNPSFYEWTTYYGIAVDGSVKKSSSSSPYVTTSYTQLISWTGDITHNSNGAKSINVGVYLYHSGPSNYLPKQYTSSSLLTMGTVSLTTIPRASSISSVTSSVAINGSNKVTVNISRKSSSFTHTVKFYINSSYTKTVSSVGTSTSYAIPTSWLSAMPSSTSCTAYCEVTTYNGSTKIGDTVKKSFTVTVPADVKPNVSVVAVGPVHSYSHSLLIQNKSKVKVDVTGCTPGTGSTIKSYTFSGPNLSVTHTSTSATSNTITTSGTLTYKVTVTDNRGRSASKTVTIYCYPWSAPIINLTPKRNLSDMKQLICQYKVTYSSVENTNHYTVILYYKTNTASTFSSITIAAGNKETVNSYTLSGLNADSTYEIYAKISDFYSGSYTTAKQTVYGPERILNIKSNGKGIALGKMAEQDNLFDCRWPMKANGFNVPEIQHGSILISPTAVNTPTNVTVTFNKEFSQVPHAVVSPATGGPGTYVLGTGVQAINTKSLTISLTRAKDTNATVVHWIAMN